MTSTTQTSDREKLEYLQKFFSKCRINGKLSEVRITVLEDCIEFQYGRGVEAQYCTIVTAKYV